jgi:hypothetical protein
MWTCIRITLFDEVDTDEADSLSDLQCVVVQDGGLAVDERYAH